MFFRKSFFLIFVISAFQSFIYSQNTITGKVLDSQTVEPLAFVNILVNDERQVFQTDIDGFFSIKTVSNIDSLRFTYVGYNTFVLKNFKYSPNITIKIERKLFLLNEVVILPGENPAHRIINKVIENRNKNNPEKMSSFSYTSYNKMVLTANVDSAKNDTAKVDSGIVSLKKFMEKSHLFLVENVTERKFMHPDKNSEKIIASRISGLKDPLLVMLFSQMQSFSFYNELFNISDKKYINPISKGSTNKYFFLLEDTLFSQNDTIYVISFKPHKNKNFDALKGLLYINTGGYAIQNVIAEPDKNSYKGLVMKIQQKYEKIENKQWFPVQLNSDIIFTSFSLSGNSASMTGKEKTEENRNFLTGKCRSYLKDIVLNPQLKKNEFSNIEVEASNVNADENNKTLTTYRYDSLSAKDKRTYQIIDSIGKKANLDRTMRTFETLMFGKIPYKFIDIDIDRLFRYNDYEGWRLGLGLHNNYKISKTFVAGGYFAYGLKDKELKYGGDVECKISDANNISLGIKYFNDVTESGSINFYENYRYINEDYYRHFMLKLMDRTEQKEIFFKFSALKYLKANISLAVSHKSVTNDYFYGVSNENVSLLINKYNFAEIGIGLCYSYKEKFIKTARYKISMGTKYPVVWFNYIRGFNNILEGEYRYFKYELKIKKSFYLKNFGSPSFQLLAGYIDGDLPYCNLYNGIGSYRQFTIAVPKSFNTMRMNEFLSNRFAALFFTHSFGKLLFRIKNFSPVIAFASNLCIGSLNNASKHFNINSKTLNKGYFESGLLINNIINVNNMYSIGVGTYYRYGYYALPLFKDNIAYKFTLTYYI